MRHLFAAALFLLPAAAWASSGTTNPLPARMPSAVPSEQYPDAQERGKLTPPPAGIIVPGKKKENTHPSYGADIKKP